MDTFGFDLGTGAIKAVRMDSAGKITASLSRRVPFNRPSPGMVENDADEYFAVVREMITSLAAESGEKIAAAAFAAASGNTLLCDRENRPLTPVINWLDTRLDWTPPESWQVRQITGWPAIPQFPLMHLEYLRRTNPDLLKTAKVTMSNEFVTCKLCGKSALDFSSATPFYLVDQTERKYHKPFLEYFGISEKQLPVLVDPGETIGTLKEEFITGSLTAETRITAGSFDHPSAALAAGITHPGELLISCGTSWVGFYPAEKRDDIPQTDLCDPFLSGRNGCWGGMFSLAGIGVEIEDFIVSRFGSDSMRYEKFNEEALKPGTPEEKMVLQVISRFREFFRGRKFSRAVMTGGPSEGAAWRKHLHEQLDMDIEISPYRGYTGAAGAALTAGKMR